MCAQALDACSVRSIFQMDVEGLHAPFDEQVLDDDAAAGNLGEVEGGEYATLHQLSGEAFDRKGDVGKFQGIHAAHLVHRLTTQRTCA